MGKINGLLGSFVKSVKDSFEFRCKYYKVCPTYNPESITCNETRGMYYSPPRPGGCYIRMQELKKDKR